jgi:hypothetical protein
MKPDSVFRKALPYGLFPGRELRILRRDEFVDQDFLHGSSGGYGLGTGWAKVTKWPAGSWKPTSRMP